MAIVRILSDMDFMSALKADEYANWSYDGAQALYNYYDQLSDDLGEPIEFDHVAIRCEWTEYNSWQDAISDYESDIMTDDEVEAYFMDKTTTLVLDNGGVLLQQF